jgi:guanine deaminase
MTDAIFLRRAFELARQGMRAGAGGPFGCVIVKDGRIVGEGYNRVLVDKDPTAHAEMVAIREACRRLDDFQLHGCVIYASCEPCPMCLGAIYWARPARIVFGAPRHIAAEAGFDDSLIYQEIALPIPKRRIAATTLLTEESATLFAEWKRKEDKTPY